MGHSRSVYTRGIGKCSESGLFIYFPVQWICLGFILLCFYYCNLRQTSSKLPRPPHPVGSLWPNPLPMPPPQAWASATPAHLCGFPPACGDGKASSEGSMAFAPGWCCRIRLPLTSWWSSLTSESLIWWCQSSPGPGRGCADAWRYPQLALTIIWKLMTAPCFGGLGGAVIYDLSLSPSVLLFQGATFHSLRMWAKWCYMITNFL